MNKEQGIKTIRAYIKHCGTQKSAALTLGISPQFLCDVLKGSRSISSIMDRLGYDEVISYKTREVKLWPLVR